MRTKEEIEKEVEYAEEFIKKHPYSMFGTDNTKHFQIFQKIIEKANRGETSSMLEEFANDAYEDSEDNSFAYAVIEWLFYDSEGPYTGE